MSQSIARPMSLAEFFAWQERRTDRYELVGGVPLRMSAGARNRHDDIVTNVLVALGSRLRGTGCPPFTGDGAVQTFPGQIRRPDVGVDCGNRDPDAFTAAEPRLVVEVMSPTTHDFDTMAKLADYQAVETLGTILYVETNWAEVTIWTGGPDRAWTQGYVLGIEGTVEVAGLGLRLPLADVYEGVAFPPGPRLIRGGPAGEAG